MKIAHLFDVMGTVVNEKVIGKRYIEEYKKLAINEKLDPKLVKETIKNYEALTNGEPWAIGEKKPGIIKALHGLLEKKCIYPNYEGVFFEDAIIIFNKIIQAGQEVVLFSTGNNSWVKEHFPNQLNGKIKMLYNGDKTKKESFAQVYEAELARGRKIISHTADTMSELKAAKEFGEIPNLIFINRCRETKKEVGKEVGIHVVKSLTKVDYPNLESS